MKPLLNDAFGSGDCFTIWNYRELKNNYKKQIWQSAFFIIMVLLKKAFIFWDRHIESLTHKISFYRKQEFGYRPSIHSVALFYQRVLLWPIVLLYNTCKLWSCCLVFQQEVLHVDFLVIVLIFFVSMYCLSSHSV